MKTFAQYLKEKWIDTVKNPVWKKPDEIYKNPSPSEWDNVVDEYSVVRGIVTKKGTGDLYIFPNRLLHQYAYKLSVSKNSNREVVPVTIDKKWLYTISLSTMNTIWYETDNLEYDNLVDLFNNKLVPNIEKNKNVKRLAAGKSVRVKKWGQRR